LNKTIEKGKYQGKLRAAYDDDINLKCKTCEEENNKI